MDNHLCAVKVGLGGVGVGTDEAVLSQPRKSWFNALVLAVSALTCVSLVERAPSASAATSPSKAYVSARSSDHVKDAPPPHRRASIQACIFTRNAQSRLGLALGRTRLVALTHTAAAEEPSRMRSRVLFSDWTARAPPAA